MKTAGITLQGTSHKMFQVPNQDAFRIREENGCVTVAVCDGVSLAHDGTWSQSEVAADYCTREFLKQTKDQVPSMDLIAEAFRKTADGLMSYLKEQAIPWIDCQCTLLGVIYDGHNLYAGLSGDGGILLENEQSRLSLMVTRPKTSSVVEPICFPAGWRFAESEGVRKVLLATDGIFDTLVQFENGTPQIDPELISQWMNADNEEMGKLAADADSHDDKTAVLILSDSSQIS